MVLVLTDLNIKSRIKFTALTFFSRKGLYNNFQSSLNLGRRRVASVVAVGTQTICPLRCGTRRVYAPVLIGKKIEDWTIESLICI